MGETVATLGAGSRGANGRGGGIADERFAASGASVWPLAETPQARKPIAAIHALTRDATHSSVSGQFLSNVTVLTDALN